MRQSPRIRKSLLGDANMPSVRARLGLVAAVVATALVPLMSSARATNQVPGDWMITRIQAGPDGAYVRYGWNAIGKRNGDDPIVMGTVRRQSGEFTSDDVYEPENWYVPINGMRVRTSQGAGGMDVEAYPSGRDTWTYGQGTNVILDANQSAILVSYVAGSTNTQEFLNWDLFLGHATVTTTTGLGTQLLRQVDKFSGGIAVDAGYASAGATTQSRSTPTGIVGGFVRVCEYCTMQWTSPDGRTGASIVRGGAYQGIGYRERTGSRFYAGPAGTWTWRWEGLQVDPRVTNQPLGAYAPVGEAWREFQDVGDFGGPDTDWVVVKIKAGGDGAALPIVESSGTLQRPSGSDAAFGVGRAGATDSYIDVSPMGDEGFATKTSDGLGSVNVEVRGNPATETDYRLSWYPTPMAAGEERVLLVFSPGALIANGVVSARSDGGSLAVTAITQGKGSGLITASGPGGGGTAVDADRALAGTGTQTTSVPTAIAGGLSFRCTSCTESWRSPDSRTGTYSHDDRVVTSTGSGRFTFAGPAGAWRWDWSGVHLAPGGAAGVVGGYAPIGSDWTWFG